MEMPVDAEARDDGNVDLIPDFFKADLPRNSIERDVYEWYVKHVKFENGAIVLSSPEKGVIEPPERLTIREFEERMDNRFGDYWAGPLRGGGHADW